MAEQVVELNPGESKLVSFEAIPHEAKTYQVSVDGLTGSFVATTPQPSPYLNQLQATLAELGHNLDTWGPSEENWINVPGYGLAPMTWGTYNMIKEMMIAEAINIGLISSASEVYFENHRMYLTKELRACPYCGVGFRIEDLDEHITSAHWREINTKGTITKVQPDEEGSHPDMPYVFGMKVTWRNDSPFNIGGHVKISIVSGYGGQTLTASDGQNTELMPGQSVTVYFPLNYGVEGWQFQSWRAKLYSFPEMKYLDDDTWSWR